MIHAARFLTRCAVVLGLSVIWSVAQTVEFRIPLDLDDDPNTGCTVNTVDGDFFGAEQVLITTVDQLTMTVTDVSIADCTGLVFAAPVSVNVGGWSVGQGNGLNGSDVIETLYPMSVFSTPTGYVRSALTASGQGGDEDALLLADGNPISFLLFIPVPTLSQWLLIVWIVLMMIVAIWWMRRHPNQRAAIMVFLLVASITFVGFGPSIVLDGDANDWSGGPVATDPSGDNGNAPDILAFFYCVQGISPNAQSLYLRIDAVLNLAPIADPQMQMLLEDDPPMTITLTGMDPEGQPLTFAIDTGPSNGLLSAITPIDATSASVDYTPNADYFGLDSFSFVVNDSIVNSVPATVELTIDPVNDVPSFLAGADQQIDKDIGPQTVPGWATAISAGPANESSQILTFIVTNNSNPALFSMTGAPAVDETSGDLTFENEPDANGTAVIELVLMDDGGMMNGGVDTSASQSFSIIFNAVNDCPVPQDDAVATDEDTLLIGDVLLDNGNGPDTDIDGPGPLVVVAVNGMAGDVGVQVSLSSGALLTQNMDGTFAYDPNGAFDVLAPGQMDTDSWTYSLDDSTALCSEAATVTVTIDGVNDCPFAADDAVTTDEDTPTSGNVLVDNGLGPDSDPESDPLNVVEVEGMPANVGVQVTLGSGALVTVNADGTFDYDPNGQFESLAVGDTAMDSFTYAIDDGSATCAQLATVSLTIDGVNDCPTAVADAVMTDEDTLLNGDVTVDNGSGADTDPESDVLNITAVNGSLANVGVQITLGSGALLTVNTDGTFAYDPNGQFESLSVGGSAMDSFTYSIDDGSGCTGLAQLSTTVDITIDGVNDCPTAVDDAVSTDEDTLLNGDVLVANPTTPDSDIEGDMLTVVQVQGVGANVGMQIALGSGALVTVNANGTFSYDPNGAFDALAAGDMAMDSFTYAIDDGSGTCTETATVTVTINGVNDCPVAVDDAATTDEDTLLNGDVYAANPTTPDSDPEGDSLVVTAVNGNPANVGIQIALGSGLVTVNANGTFSFDPSSGYESLGVGDSAMEMFTYTIDDGSGTCAETATVTVTINGVNDCPVAVDDAVGTLENMVLNGDVLVANPTTPDSDIEGDGLDVTAVNGNSANVGVQFALASGALLTVNANGTFSYDANGAFVLTAGQMTTDMFTYTIDDGSGTCAETATVTLTITGVNDPPIILDENFQTAGNRAIGNTTFEFANASAVTTPRVFVMGDVLDNDTDAETPGLLSITAFDAASTAGGAIAMNMTTGEFTYQPPLGETTLTDTFTYTVSDNDPGMPMTAMGTVTIDVVDMVWFIDGDAGAGIGSSVSPFNNIPAFMAEQGMMATDDPDVGDRIFVYDAAMAYDAATPAGITLLDGQILHGEGIDLVVDTVALNVVGGNPSIANGPVITNTNGANGDVVTLAMNNTVQGMTLQPQNSAGIAAGIEPRKQGHASGKVGTAAIDYVSFQTSNASDGLALFGRAGLLTITNSNILGMPGASGSGFRVEFSDPGGFTVNAMGLTIDQLGTAIRLFNNPASVFTFTDLNIGGTFTTTRGIDAANSGTVNVMGTSNIETNGGMALDLAGPLAIAMTFNNIQSDMSANHGIEITAGVTGSFSATNTTISDASTRGVNIDSSFTLGGDSANFGNTTITANGTDAIRINGSPGTFTFNNLGNMTTVTGTGLIAINSGTVNLTGTSPTFNANGGPAINIENTAGMFNFQNPTSSNSPGNGIRLVNVLSPVTVTGTSVINNASQTSVLVSGGSMSTTLGDLNIDNRDDVGIEISNINQVVVFGDTTIDNQTTDNTDSLMITSSMGASVTFSSLDINHNSAPNNGISLSSNVGSVTINGAASDISGAGGIAFQVSGGQGDVTYAGSITNTASRSVEVMNRMAGTVAFNGNISDSGTGIFLNNNTGSTINFSGDLDLDTGANNAFTATGGGTVSATGINNAIGSMATPITGVGVTIQNTTIGAPGVTFRQIHVNGATSGIVLNTTGTTGSFQVTGDGSTANSGGIINASTQNGVDINTSTSPSLNYMTISNANDHEVLLQNVVGFTMTESTVSDTTNIVGAAGDDENGIHALNLFGISLIQNVDFPSINENGIFAANTTADDGTRDELVVDGCTFSGHQSEHGENGVLIQPDGTSLQRVEVNNSTFTINAEGALGVIFSSIGMADFEGVIDGNTFNCGNAFGSGGIQSVTASDSTAAIEILNNTINNGNFFAILCNADDDAALDATIMGNMIDGTVCGGCTNRLDRGVNVRIDVDPVATVLIDTNVVSVHEAEGIFAEARDIVGGPGSLDITVTNNNVDMATMIAHGISIRQRDTNPVCSEISGNTSVGNDGGFPGLGEGIHIDQDTGVHNLEQGMAALADPVVTVLSLNNPATTTFSIGGAITNVVNGTCNP